METAKAAMLAIATLVLAPCSAMGATCPPDGNGSLLPTYDVEDQCGSYDKCTELERVNRLAEATACSRKIDDCAVALNKSNAEAEAHNAAIEACRYLIPNRPKTTSTGSSTNKSAPSSPKPGNANPGNHM
jgi:hypothetical protein